jgi:hypothetical protein
MGDEIRCLIEADPVLFVCWWPTTGVFGKELPRVCVCVAFCSGSGFSTLTLSLLLFLGPKREKNDMIGLEEEAEVGDSEDVDVGDFTTAWLLRPWVPGSMAVTR